MLNNPGFEKNAFILSALRQEILNFSTVLFYHFQHYLHGYERVDRIGRVALVLYVRHEQFFGSARKPHFHMGIGFK